MRMMLGLVAAAALAACSGKRTYESNGAVDTTGDSTRVSVPDIDVGVKKDTLTVPTVGIEKDTLIVSKPVIGKKQVEVQRPTVTVHKKP